MIKITDEQAAKLGISSFEDLEAKINGGKKADAELSALAETVSGLSAKVKTLESSVASLPKIDTDAIVKQAVEKANAEAVQISAKAVSAAIAKAGQSGLAPNKPETEGNETNSEASDNDPEAQWAKNANLRAEFNDSKSTFLAYHKAQTLGRISSVTKTVKN